VGCLSQDLTKEAMIELTLNFTSSSALRKCHSGLSRFRVVGTTVKSPKQLPKDLVADEKHSWLKGERVYIATTAAQGWILGASVAKSSAQADLEKADSVG
jgi:hypothetical protein